MGACRAHCLRPQPQGEGLAGLGFEPESVSQGSPSVVGGEGPSVGEGLPFLHCHQPGPRPEAPYEEAVGVGGTAGSSSPHQVLVLGIFDNSPIKHIIALNKTTHV